MGTFTRRDFLTTSLAGTGLAVAAPVRASAPAAKFSGTDVVELGKTGIKVSFLAQGTGYNGTNHSSAQTRQGKEAFDRLLHHSLDHGISFLDMADLYGSHPFVKEVVKGMPRNKLTMLSKIWPTKANWVTPSGGTKREVDRFRKDRHRLSRHLLDPLHDELQVAQAVREDPRRAFPTQGKRGRPRRRRLLPRPGSFKVAAEHPWVDVIFARVNNKCGKKYSCDGTVEEVTSSLKTARKNGKAVVGMKIFGAGMLVKPEEKDASLKFVLGNGLVDAMTIGMMNTGEVDDTLARMAA